MPIVRMEKRDEPYAQICRSTLQDETLTYEAIGMLAHLLSRPQNWQISPTQLQRHCGRDKVYRILNELIKARYIKKQVIRNEAGAFVDTEYVVFETPFTENPQPFPEKPYTENPDAAKPTLKNKELKEERLDNSPNGAHSEKSEEQADNETSLTLSDVSQETSPLATKERKPSKKVRSQDAPPADKGQWVVSVKRGNITAYLAEDTTGNNPPDAKCLGYTLDPTKAIVYASRWDALSVAGRVFEATNYHTDPIAKPKGRGLPPQTIWDAMQHATYSRSGVGSGGVVTKLAWVATNTYGDVRGLDMTDEGNHPRCCNAIMAFAKEWKEKGLDTIVNEDTYNHHFTLFLQNHAPKAPAAPARPQPATAHPPRFLERLEDSDHE